MNLSTSSRQIFVETLKNGLSSKLSQETINEWAADQRNSDLSRYQDNPVGFAKDILNITVTDDIATMLESVRDNTVTLAKSATGTGKSHGASVAAIWFYSVFPDSRVYTVANPFENQRILWGELGSMADSHPALFEKDTVTDFNIRRYQKKKDFIRALPYPTTGTDSVREGKFSGKHHQHMLFVVDECDCVENFAFKGIQGCMSGGLVKRILLLFNPRAQVGEPYRLERDPGAANVIHLSAFNHPNVITGDQVIPGAVDRETTVQRINEWCRPLHENEQESMNTFRLPEFLIGAVARRKGTKETYPPLKAGAYFIEESAFHYMVLGEYPPQPASQLISREWTSNARARYDAYVSQHGNTPPAQSLAIMGLDVSELGEDSNVAAFRYGGFVPPLVIWAGIDTYATGDRAVREYNERNVLRCNVDATGTGSGVAPHMNMSKCLAIPVKVAESPVSSCDLGDFKILRDELWWRCREWLRTDPGAMLPPDERLLEELHTPTYEVDGGKIRVMQKKVMRELLGRSPDRADALCLTFAPGGFFSDCDIE